MIQFMSMYSSYQNLLMRLYFFNVKSIHVRGIETISFWLIKRFKCSGPFFLDDINLLDKKSFTLRYKKTLPHFHVCDRKKNGIYDTTLLKLYFIFFFRYLLYAIQKVPYSKQYRIKFLGVEYFAMQKLSQKKRRKKIDNRENYRLYGIAKRKKRLRHCVNYFNNTQNYSSRGT